MEKRRVPLIIKCNRILINPKEYWGEIIQLAFIENELENISITRLPYEDEIYIEHNDQINCAYSFYKDVYFTLEDGSLLVEFKPKIKWNMSDKIKIILSQTVDNMEEILSALKADPS